MKKITTLCILSIVLFLMCICFSQWTASAMEISLVDVTGDRQVITPVRLTMELNDIHQRYYQMRLEQGSTHTSLKEGTYMENTEVAYRADVELQLTQEMKQQLQFLEYNQEPSSTMINGQVEPLIMERAEVKKAQVSIALSTSSLSNIDASVDGIVEDMTIPTQLSIVSTPDNPLYFYRGRTLDQKEPDFEEGTLEYTMSYQNRQLWRVDAHTYVFMPDLTPEMEGTADLYRIQLVPDTNAHDDMGDTKVYMFQAESIDAFPVSLGTSAIFFYQNDTGYMITSMDGASTITVYDESLQKVKTQRLERSLKELRSTHVYLQGQTAILQNDQTAYILDLQSLRLLHVFDMLPDMDVWDAWFEQGILYLITTKRYDKLSYSPNECNPYLYAVRDNGEHTEVLYQGVLRFHDDHWIRQRTEHPGFQAGVYWMNTQFVRE